MTSACETCSMAWMTRLPMVARGIIWKTICYNRFGWWRQNKRSMKSHWASLWTKSEKYEFEIIIIYSLNIFAHYILNISEKLMNKCDPPAQNQSDVARPDFEIQCVIHCAVENFQIFLLHYNYQKIFCNFKWVLKMFLWTNIHQILCIALLMYYKSMM